MVRFQAHRGDHFAKRRRMIRRPAAAFQRSSVCIVCWNSSPPVAISGPRVTCIARSHVCLLRISKTCKCVCMCVCVSAAVKTCPLDQLGFAGCRSYWNDARTTSFLFPSVPLPVCVLLNSSFIPLLSRLLENIYSIKNTNKWLKKSNFIF